MSLFDSPAGQRALERLASDQIIWLTTVTARGAPIPRPVWFQWDGATIIVYTESSAFKVKQIASNPLVALNFNSDPTGGDVQVIVGTAEVDPDVPSAIDNAEYLAKYQDGIKSIGMDEVTFSRQFDTGLRITPDRVRGIAPLPET